MITLQIVTTADTDATILAWQVPVDMAAHIQEALGGPDVEMLVPLNDETHDAIDTMYDQTVIS